MSYPAGLKVKLAHKRAGSEKWSASEAAQRRHLIAALQQLIGHLQLQALPAANNNRANGAKKRKSAVRTAAVT